MTMLKNDRVVEVKDHTTNILTDLLISKAFAVSVSVTANTRVGNIGAVHLVGNYAVMVSCEL